MKKKHRNGEQLMVGRGQVGLEWLGNMYGYKSLAVGIMELLNLFVS